MGHRDNLLVTLNLSGSNNHGCRPHPRGSVRRADGFVLTSNPEVIQNALENLGRTQGPEFLGVRTTPKLAASAVECQSVTVEQDLDW